MYIHIYTYTYMCIHIYIYIHVCVCVCVHVKLLHSCRLCAMLWTVGHKASLSMEFSRQKYWSDLACPPSGDLPGPGIKPMPLMCVCVYIHFNILFHCGLSQVLNIVPCAVQ